MDGITRRTFLKSAAGATLAAGAPPLLARAAAAATPATTATPYVFFNATEASFIEAAVARLIPNDDLGPGAIEAGVPSYIDKQLAAAWGAGERLYRSGPWQEGSASQGYQLPYTPADLFRTALRGIDADARNSAGKTFAQMSAAEQDQYLTSLQKGERDLNGVPSKVFFESLLTATIEGYFSDPVYGGNKDMAAWKMIGFPGAYASYYHYVDQHNLKFDRAPMSLAQTADGRVHVHPQIRATPKAQELR